MRVLAKASPRPKSLVVRIWNALSLVGGVARGGQLLQFDALAGSGVSEPEKRALIFSSAVQGALLVPHAMGDGLKSKLAFVRESTKGQCG